MKTKILYTAIIVVLLSNQSFAQNTRERSQNRKQITEGKKNLERDIKELSALKIKIATFNKVFDNRNLPEVKASKISILTDFRREVAQSEQKAIQARKEVRQSTREVRSEKKEIHQNRHDNQRGRYDGNDDRKDMARDRANKRDDKRDRRDDVRDFEAQIARAATQKQILNELTNFTFGFKGDLLEKSIKKRMLVTQFIQTMEQDIVATKREISEDKRESKEDLFERRDDRNERNEVDKKRRRW